MTAVEPKDPKQLLYPSRTVERAKRALTCSPFHLHLFETMRSTSVSLKAVTGDAGIQNRYTKRFVYELAAENALTWLIQVGVLRREVDGQGITDRFCLTPLGRQLVEYYQDALGNASWLDHFYNALIRWFRLPF